MAAGKEDQLTFSWEWFNIEGPDRARKLQEDGLLDIRMEKIGENYEITQTHFLSDVSLRVLDRDQSSADQDPRKPTWRVKILKDSDIEWPTFAGGHVLTASEAAAWHSANPPPPSFWSSLIKVASDNTTGTTEANDSQ